MCDHLKIDPAAVLAMGDNLSDRSMLEWADVCVAPENAIEAVKATADHIAPNNDADGVAWAINHLVLPPESTQP